MVAPLVTMAGFATGVGVSLSPATVTLGPGASTPLTATVTGSSNLAVTWKVDGIVNGNATVGTLAPQGGLPAVRQTYHTAGAKLQTGVNVVAGDLVCVGWIVGNSPAGANTSCADSSGNTYAEVGGTGSSGYSYSAAAGAMVYQFYTVAAVTSAALTVTISSLNTNTDCIYVAVVQGAGASRATVLDAFVNSADAALGSAHATNALTTTSPNDFLFSVWGNDQIDGVLAEGASGFTLAAQTTGGATAACTKVAGLAGSSSETVTSSVALREVNVLAAFKAALGNTAVYRAPATGGSHTVVATSVADPSQSASATAVTASTPVFGAAVQPVFQVGMPGSATLPAASDPNGSPLTYQAAGLPAGCTFAPASRVLSGTLASPGSYSFSLTATDGYGLAATLAMTLVAAAPPVLGAAVQPVFQVGVPGSYTLPASSDPNGPLGYQVSGLPVGCAFASASRVLSGTLATPGTYPFSYTATDGLGLASTLAMTLVAAAPPVLGAAIQPGFQVGVPGSFTLPAGTDPNGPLSYQVSGLPGSCTFAPASRVVTGTMATIGTYPFTYTVTDALGFAATGALTLAVTPRTPSQLSFAFTTQYAYDDQGRLKTTTYPSGNQVTCGYDPLDRVTQITRNGQVIVRSLDYDADEWANPHQIQYLSGALDQRAYDPTGTRLQQWTIGTVGGLPQARSYGYDSLGRLTQAGEWSSLVYDPSNRLTAATGFGFTDTLLQDAFGNNRSSVSTPHLHPSMVNYTFDPELNNRVPGVAANGGITDALWSADGEIMQIGTDVSTNQDLYFTWDDLGRLASSRFAAGSMMTAESFAYSADGLRVSRADTVKPDLNRVYAYSHSGQLLGEYTNNGALAWNREVVYLGGLAVAEVDAGGLVHELHSDPLGTPRVVTAGLTGLVEGGQAYAPYGEFIPASGPYTPLTGYTGHVQTEPNGLIYMRGRYYSPAWHCFLNSNDGQDPNQLNQFAYCNGNPLMNTDPTGLDFSSNYQAMGESAARGEHQYGSNSSGVNSFGGGENTSAKFNISVAPVVLNFQIPGVPQTPAATLQGYLEAAGYSATVVQYSTPGMTVAYTGSSVGKFYVGWFGNQYVQVARISSMTQGIGYGLAAVSAGTTIAQVANGEVSAGKGAFDLAGTGYATLAGPAGIGLAATKSVLERNWATDGGWGQMLKDAGGWYGNKPGFGWLGHAFNDAGNYYSGQH